MEKTEPEPIVSATNQQVGGMNRGKGIVLAIIAAVLFVGGGVYYAQHSGDADASALAPASVAITREGFDPATVRVKKGQQISWHNADLLPHQVTSSDVRALRLENSTVLERNDSATVTFEQSGTYQYHDNLSNPGFQGTVIVE